MTTGLLLNAGQEYFLNVVFKNQVVGDLYLGLMTKGDLNSVPANLQTDLAMNIGSGLTEVTGTDYARATLVNSSNWTLTTGTISKVTGLPVEFLVGTGDWADVNGYFVALSAVEGTADAIWAESFPTLQQGTKAAGDTVKVTPSFVMKDDNE